MTASPPEVFEITALDVKPKFEAWIKTRGGVAVWSNQDLSNIDRGNMYTPATMPDGKPVDDTVKPHWAMALKEIVTDIARFKFVKEMKEVKRFRVALRGAFLSVKLTDGSTKKVRKWCGHFRTQYNVEPCYRFDYETQECIIEVPVFES